MNPLRSVGGRLALALLVVVAGALAIVYVVVVPSYERSLIDTRLRKLDTALRTIVAQGPTATYLQQQWVEEEAPPLADARVVVAWREVAIDTATMSSSVEERTGAVQTDSLGRYRLCGVPTDSWLLLQVQHDGRAGAGIRLLVPDSAGVAMRHLSLSASASSPVAAAPAAADDTTEPPPLTGTASVAGVIRGVGGLPLSGAQVRIVGAAGRSTSDARGRFALGDLPAGTQVLEVRRIGYLLTQQPVELRAGRTAEQDVRLQRIVTLDSLRVLAQRSRYPEFEQRRKTNGFGTFFTADDIADKRPFQTSDLFRMILGFRVSGLGLDAKVFSTRGVTSMGGVCSPNIVIDGMPNQELNLIHPSSIGAMEVYRAGQPAPPQYDRGCGAILIWSKR